MKYTFYSFAKSKAPLGMFSLHRFDRHTYLLYQTYPLLPPWSHFWQPPWLLKYWNTIEKNWFSPLQLQRPGWVSSTPFGIPFCLPVHSEHRRGSSPFIICKLLVLKDFNNISASFQNLFVVVFTWKRMELLHSSLLQY